MTAVDDVDAVLADPTLTEAQRSAQVKRIRAQAFVDALAHTTPFTVGPVTVTGLSVFELRSGALALEITGTGGPPLLWPIHVVNPPLLADDPDGDVRRPIWSAAARTAMPGRFWTIRPHELFDGDVVTVERVAGLRPPLGPQQGVEYHVVTTTPNTFCLAAEPDGEPVEVTANGIAAITRWKNYRHDLAHLLRERVVDALRVHGVKVDG